MISYHFKIQPEKEGGFTAECLEIEGCRTQADSIDELRKNMKEVLNLCLDEPEDSRLTFPVPRTFKKIPGNVEVVEPDQKILLAQLLRQARLKAGLSQQEMANRLQFKAISHYQKLEKRANPTFDTMIRLKRALPEFQPDLIFK